MVTILQVMVLVFMIFLLGVTTNRFRKQKIRLVAYVFWMIIWFGVIVMAFIPTVLGGIAKFTGTSPGDLVTRIAIIVAFYFIFLLETKISEISQQIKILEEYLKRGVKK